MAEDNKDEQLLKGLTSRTIIIGIIMVTLISIYVGFMVVLAKPPALFFGPYGTPGRGYSTITLVDYLSLLLFLCFIVSAVYKFGKLSIQEVTCLWTMILTTSLLGGPFGGGIGNATFGLGAMYVWRGESYPLYILAKNSISPLMTPLDDQVFANGLLLGPGTVPWLAWIGPIAFYTICIASGALYFIFLGALFRKQYIDIESLPYPMASVEQQVLELTQVNPKSERKIPHFFTAKWFWLGIAIALIFGGYDTYLNALTPPQAVPIKWMQALPYFAPFVIVVLAFDPAVIAFAYILPLNLLISTVISMFVMQWLLPPLFYYAGKMPTYVPGNTPGPLSWAAGGLNFLSGGITGEQFPHTWIYWGVLFGAAIYTMWRGRHVVKDIINSFQRKEQVADREAFSYKIIFAGVLVFGLLSIGLQTALYIPLWYSVPLFLLMTILTIGHSRTRAEAGGMMGRNTMGAYYLGSFANQNWEQSLFNWGGMMGSVGAKPGYESQVFNSVAFGGLNAITNQSLAMPNIMEAFKLGAQNRTKTRDILLSSVIALVIAIPINFVTVLAINYGYNIQSMFTIGGGRVWTRMRATAWNAETPAMFVSTGTGFWDPNNILQGKTLSWGFLIAGLLVTIFAYFMRGRYSWFFFTPMGLFLEGALTPYLIIFIAVTAVKYVAVRIKGYEFNEKVVSPIAFGILVGIGLLTFLYGLISALNMYGIVR